MREAYIRFMAPVSPVTAASLLRIIDKRLHTGVDRLHLLISSPGGSVFHGISIHNYLKGIPIEVYTYNFGSVDSIGVVLFCAGKQRFSVPHARFLIHGVRFNTNAQCSFDVSQLSEHRNSLTIDERNIARVIADTCGKTADDVTKAMEARTTLHPKDAKEFGLVHEIKSDLLPANAHLEVIYEDASTGGGSPTPAQRNVPRDAMPFIIPGMPGQPPMIQLPIAPPPPLPPEPCAPSGETGPNTLGYTQLETINHFTSAGANTTSV